MKRRDGKSQRREEKTREEEKISKRERVRRKKIQVREKVGKSRNTVFFKWFVAPEGRKVGSLKRRVRSHVVRWEMKSCTPLWREAHFQVKMYETPQLGSTFRSSDVEKEHAVVARSTFPSQNVQSTPGSEHFWKLRCRKSFKNWGSLAELLRFWCVQVQKLRKSRRLASFSSLQINRWRDNYNYKYHTLHYTTLLLQLQVQIYYATLHNTNYTALH